MLALLIIVILGFLFYAFIIKKDEVLGKRTLILSVSALIAFFILPWLAMLILFLIGTMIVYGVIMSIISSRNNRYY